MPEQDQRRAIGTSANDAGASLANESFGSACFDATDFSASGVPKPEIVGVTFEHEYSAKEDQGFVLSSVEVRLETFVPQDSNGQDVRVKGFMF